VRRHLWRGALAIALGLGFGAYLIGCGEDTTPTAPSSSEPAPAAVSPAAALRRLEWIFNHRSVDVYRTLLSADFVFVCSPTDSAGAAWTRDDELQFANHLFLGGGGLAPATRIQLTLDKNFFVFPDPTCPWDPTGRWHRNVQSILSLVIALDEGSAYELQGHTNFYLVRGDSAAIAVDPRAPGVVADSTTWFLRRWDDETATEGGSPLRAAQPTSNKTLCELKSLYR